MTLRTQLKGVKMQMSESIQSYFTRVSQIKEKLESIGDNAEEEEVKITNLNGIPSSFRGFFSRKKLTYGGMHVRRNSIDRKRRRYRLI